jgi:hypothetical protein
VPGCDGEFIFPVTGCCVVHHATLVAWDAFIRDVGFEGFEAALERHLGSQKRPRQRGSL